MGRWTDAGWVSYSLTYYKDLIERIFKEAFGDDFDVDSTTEQGILIQRLAELFYNADMDGVEAFSRLNLDSATGVYLDLFGNMRSIPRNLGKPQKAVVTITCSPQNFLPFTIPAGTQFTSLSGSDVFILEQAATIEATSTGATLTYNQSGNSTQDLGGKLQVNGYSQITDIEITALVAGSDREDDLSYRRRLQTQYPAANNTIQYVETLIASQQNVRAVGHNYNDTAETVGGLPPYTTEWMAAPDASVTSDTTGTALNIFKQEIAKIIIDNKVPGSPTYGNTTQQVNDIFGDQKTVNFTIPDKIDIQIQVVVGTPQDTGFLDLSRVGDITSAIENYINTLDIGKDVIYSRCLAPLAADKGFEVISFKICNKAKQDWVTNGSYPIGGREYANVASGDIQIGV